MFKMSHMFRPLTADAAALLVIDMQNGFCHPEGSFARLGMDIRMCTDAVPACGRLVETARSRGIPVIFTRYVFRADYRDGGLLTSELMPALADGESLAAGTWDAAPVDELTPEEPDFLVDKNRFSAFYGTGLETVLTSLGIRQLVMCGVTTNMCVESTARDASQRDYRVHVISDATGELDVARHEAALDALRFGFCRVTTESEVHSAWSASTRPVSAR